MAPFFLHLASSCKAALLLADVLLDTHSCYASGFGPSFRGSWFAHILGGFVDFLKPS
jgi:hypothetical protein